MKRIKAKYLALTALFTALIAVGAFLKIPSPLVPFTLQTTFVGMAGLLLGKRYGTLSVAIYVALGLIGVPIFTAGGGPQYVLQPTFGFLLGFLCNTALTGYLAERAKRKNTGSFLLASLAGLILTYVVGVAYGVMILRLYLHSESSFGSILNSFCLIFLPTDILTACLGAFLCAKLYPLLHRAAPTPPPSSDAEGKDR